MIDEINLLKKEIENSFNILTFSDDLGNIIVEIKKQYEQLNKRYKDLNLLSDDYNDKLEIKKYYVELITFYDYKIVPIIDKLKKIDNNKNLFDNTENDINQKINEKTNEIIEIINHFKLEYEVLGNKLSSKLKKIITLYQKNLKESTTKSKTDTEIELGINSNTLLTLGTPSMISTLHLKDLELFIQFDLMYAKKIVEKNLLISKLTDQITDKIDIMKYSSKFIIKCDEILNKLLIVDNDKEEIDALLNNSKFDITKKVLDLLINVEDRLNIINDEVNNLYNLYNEDKKYDDLISYLNNLKLSEIDYEKFEEIESIVLSDSNHEKIEQLKSIFYNRCFDIITIEFIKLNNSHLYNNLNEISKKHIENIFMNVLNQRKNILENSNEILKNYLNNGLSSDIICMLFSTKKYIINNLVHEKKDIVTLLETNQIIGDNKLSVFEKYGSKAALTDFSIVLGGYASDECLSEEKILENRTGEYFTKTLTRDGGVQYIDDSGLVYGTFFANDYGGRPVIPLTHLKHIINLNVFKKNKIGILELEYGEYPQKVVTNKIGHILERNFKNGTLKATGNKYTTNSSESGRRLEKTDHLEYEFEGKKYVRVKSKERFKPCYVSIIDATFYDDSYILSNGKKYHKDDYVWLEVEPIKWLIDEDKKLMISEKILFSRIWFNSVEGVLNFENTDIYNFLNNEFIKEIKFGQLLESDLSLNELSNILQKEESVKTL